MVLEIYQEARDVVGAMDDTVHKDGSAFDLVTDEVILHDENPIAQGSQGLIVWNLAEMGVANQVAELRFYSFSEL